MIYNTKTKYLSCPVGGAITIDSDPEKEYEECQTKISRILNM
jgi:para-aminobenzoate synthetase component 1